eukprot:GHRR01037364.1.p1 GENE.GHRR01037364.1~~GHRR01037364.1.p1  ORF type:complete len:235 (+),score=39.26 GHRR01037364.1:187-891(+)
MTWGGCCFVPAGKPPQLVSVPTHYFKVVLAENSSSRHGTHQAAVGAFVMPNAPIDPQTPVTAFAVPLEALESVSGVCNTLPMLMQCGAGFGKPSLQWYSDSIGQQLYRISQPAILSLCKQVLPASTNCVSASNYAESIHAALQLGLLAGRLEPITTNMYELMMPICLIWGSHGACYHSLPVLQVGWSARIKPLCCFLALRLALPCLALELPVAGAALACSGGTMFRASMMLPTR